MQTQPPRSIRRFFQFGLKSLLLVTVACAVPLTWWRQRSLVGELEANREDLKRCQAELAVEGHLHRVYRALDLNKPKHREAFDALQTIPAGTPLQSRWIFWGERFVRRHRDEAQVEVLLFHNDSGSIPGAIATVAILLRDREVIDFAARFMDPREEFHDAELRDADGNGATDVVIHCHPGIWRTPDSQPFDVVYAITPEGFVQQ